MFEPWLLLHAGHKMQVGALCARGTIKSHCRVVKQGKSFFGKVKERKVSTFKGQFFLPVVGFV